jgi:hypothetical protein
MTQVSDLAPGFLVLRSFECLFQKILYASFEHVCFQPMFAVNFSVCFLKMKDLVFLLPMKYSDNFLSTEVME